MAVVELDHVTKEFPGGARAISDVCLTVADGELLVVVGPSGCGKSTLLRLVAGLEEVSSGVLRIGDREVTCLSPRERNIAMVFQDYALYPNMSVRGNLEFPLRMAKLAAAERERRVAWAAEILGLGVLLERMPRQLSGGQRQRVAMGRALVREPAVFLLDEPLSNLDAKLRSQVRAEIAELQQRMRSTMLYVTHDQVEAMTLGDRVAVLNAGVLQQAAAPQEIYDHPANAFVAGFIGNPPMNVPAATVTVSDGAITVHLGQQRLRVASPDAEWLLRLPRAPERLGIRPEDLALATAETEAALVAEVSHVEYLGHETLVYASFGAGEDDRLIVRLAGRIPFERGDALRLKPQWDRAHFFDANGVAIEPA